MGNMPRPAGIRRAALWRRFPRRGGNYNNGSNAGLGYVNSNNARSNANTNYGCRPRSLRTSKAPRSTRPRPTVRKGGACFPRSGHGAQTTIPPGPEGTLRSENRTGTAAKRPEGRKEHGPPAAAHTRQRNDPNGTAVTRGK